MEKPNQKKHSKSENDSSERKIMKQIATIFSKHNPNSYWQLQQITELIVFESRAPHSKTT